MTERDWLWLIVACGLLALQADTCAQLNELEHQQLTTARIVQENLRSGHLR